ncbi:MAG: iron-containing alcohol dehydrogenase [Kofleriaceae bacterium]|nr:iron-containing alcohol dehydrogenase [Kofleriaceae bacterium]
MSRRFVAQRGATRVVFAAGAWEQVGTEAARLGVSRVLIVATPGRRAAAEAVAAALGARAAGIAAIAVEHVPVEVAARARRAADDARADAVLAIGGGSAIGLGKAVALEGRARLIALPTTYSGSEMTSIWGLTDGGVKRTGRDDRVRAQLVLYDPRATVGLPVGTSADSLWNAAAHAVEALWFPDVDPISELVAEEALRLIARALPAVVARPDDVAARTDALEGAFLAGATLADAGTGLHHKLCHVLGGMLGLPHAATHAALLPHVVRFHRAAAPRAMTRIARALGAADAADRLTALAARSPRRDLASLLGATPAATIIERVIDAVLAAPPPGPRPLDRDGLRGLLTAALAPGG